MISTRTLVCSVATWLAVGGFWYVTTREHHPTVGLALTVTISLVVAYALAAYVNHLWLVPRYFLNRQYGRYVIYLIGVMVGFTAVALTIVRHAYLRSQGPDSDPNGTLKHFAIDLVGMVVHLALAAAVVWSVGRFAKRRKERARGKLKLTHLSTRRSSSGLT